MPHNCTVGYSLSPALQAQNIPNFMTWQPRTSPQPFVLFSPETSCVVGAPPTMKRGSVLSPQSSFHVRPHATAASRLNLTSGKGKPRVREAIIGTRPWFPLLPFLISPLSGFPFIGNTFLSQKNPLFPLLPMPIMGFSAPHPNEGCSWCEKEPHQT